jgi:hypothetical protein
VRRSKTMKYLSAIKKYSVAPGDYKLVSGENTIQLYGGRIFNPTDTVTLGFGTPAARLDK